MNYKNSIIKGKREKDMKMFIWLPLVRLRRRNQSSNRKRAQKLDPKGKSSRRALLRPKRQRITEPVFIVGKMDTGRGIVLYTWRA